jgi:hypothetical protein
MQLTPEYWIAKTDRAVEALHPPGWIEAFNATSIATDPHLVDLPCYPGTVSGAELRRLIESVSKPHETPLYFHDDHGGRRLEAADYDRYRERMALDEIPEFVRVRFGLILQRTNMRSWPTREFVFRSPETRDLDRFQENGLFPGEAVAVLHESADGKWLFVRSYNYHAWVRRQRVVLGERDVVMGYAQSEPFLVVTGARASTNFNPVDSSVSEIVLDMGARLPLTKPEQLPAHVDGQNPVASFAVQLPVCRDDGRLDFKTVLIARGQDVGEGYLPPSRENAIRQAFKFLGERYGWGHSYNARDCTGLVLEVYRSMGILLPRNSSQQGSSPIGDNIRFGPDAGDAERMRALRRCAAGDLLYTPGHVMMLLGFERDEPWVIHDMSGSGWVDEKGEPVEGVMNGVAVTPLTTTQVTPKETYFEQLYAIKKIL